MRSSSILTSLAGRHVVRMLRAPPGNHLELAVVPLDGEGHGEHPGAGSDHVEDARHPLTTVLPRHAGRLGRLQLRGQALRSPVKVLQEKGAP